MRHRLVIVCLALGLLHPPARAAAPPRAGGPSFLAYLREGTPPAALVAYSPTNHDPRPAPHRKVPPRDSVRKDLDALARAFDGLILSGPDKEVAPAVRAEAARLGFRAVLLGVWDPRSEAELAGVAGLVRRHH